MGAGASETGRSPPAAGQAFRTYAIASYRKRYAYGGALSNEVATHP